MKTSIIAVFLLITTINIYAQSEYELIINNEIHISELNAKINSTFPESNNIQFTQSLESTSFNCEPNSEIIGMVGDSIYVYDINNSSAQFVTNRVHGIYTGFGLLKNDDLTIVTSTDWDSVYYFNDSIWEFSGFHTDGSNDLIGVSSGTHSTFFIGSSLWYFNGSSNPRVIRENIKYTSADLAVDENENAWVLTGTTWPISDTLRIIDSTGISICDIPFNEPINTINAYGMAIKDEKVIVGFGPSNFTFPNSIVPLEIDSLANSVQFGNPIATNIDITGDLASCMKAIDLPNCNLVNSIKVNRTNNIKVYPNPFDSRITIESKNIVISEIEVFNSLGQKLKKISPDSSNIDLNLKDLRPGHYWIVIHSIDAETVIKELIIKI